MKMHILTYRLLLGLYTLPLIAEHVMPVKITTTELKNRMAFSSLEAQSLERHERVIRKKPFKRGNTLKPLPTSIKNTNGFYPKAPHHFYDSSCKKNGLSKTGASSVAYVPQIGVNFTPSTRWDAAVPVPEQGFPEPGSFGVGPTQVLSLAYTAMRSFDKAGNPDFVLDLDSAQFFAPTGFQLPTDFTGDLTSHYDSLSERWFVLGNTDLPFGENTIQPRLFLAVSDGPIITNNTEWTYYTFVVSDIPPAVPSRPYLDADFPQMGVDTEAIYIGYDEFDLADTSYFNSTVLVIQKSSVLNGGPAVINAFRDLFVNDGTYDPCGVNNYCPHPQYGFVIGFQLNSSFDVIGLNLYRIANPGSTHPTILPVESLPINPIINFLFAPQLGNLYNETGLIETGLGSITCAVIRNNQLYTCFDAGMDATGNTNVAVADRTGSLWFQYDVSQAVSTLVQSGNIFDSAAVNPRSFYWPGITVNKRGDVVLASSVSAVDEYINMMVVGRFASDPLGQMSNPLLVTNSQGPLNAGPNPSYGGQRFGESTGVVVDPCDNQTIWASAEWVKRQDEWAVQVVQLLPPSLPK